MKRKITFLTAAFALLAFLAIPMGMRGQTREAETFTFSGLGYENAADVTTVEGDNVTLTFAQGEGNNPPKYYTSGSAVRMYTNNTLEVALNDQTGDTRITAINFTFSGTYSGSLTNWTGSETSVSFTNTASGQARIQVIAVTFADGDTPQPTTYTVTYDCNGGTSGCPANVTNITAGTQIQLADAPSRDNYEFDGWSDGTTTYGENVDYTVNGNVTFTAQWTENTTPGGDGTTATLNIQNYATANNWENGTKYTTATVNPVTFTAAGGANTGKYYTSGQEWRYYQGESASITISVPDGYTLVSVTPTYNVQNNGVLMNGNSTIASGSTVSVSGTSVTFTVGNSGTATNGQVRFTNIDVVYVSDGGTQTTSDLTITNQTTDLTFDLYNNSNAQVITYTTSSTGAITITPAESDYFTYVHDAQNKTITVTPTAVTPSAQTVTISQAADDDYYAGTASFTVSITDSAPLANIAALTEQTVASTYNVALSDAVVTYVNGNYAYIQDASGAVVYYKNGHGLTAGDVLNGTATVVYQLRNGNPQITNLTGVTPVPGTAPDPTEVAASAWNYTFSNVLSQYFKVTGATITQSNNKYYVSLGGESIQLYKAGGSISSLDLTKTYSITGFPTMYNTTKELQIFVDPEVEDTGEPSVTVTPATINAPAEGANGTLAITYENIPDLISFDYYFCDANGGELEGNDPDWIYAEINEEDGAYTISYTINPNEGEARTAYFKVYTPEAEDVYALVTVNQAEYVAPVLDYAELPFEFNGGKADIEGTDGLTQEGLGNDYSGGNNTTTPLKFDSTDDWLLLHFNERPGTLTFDITGNGFSGGTFKVQTSEDGETYTDLETYTELGNTQHESFDNLGENVRYIKWIYTEKVSGNVGLGTIALAEYTEPAHAIVIDPDLFEIGAEGGENGFEYTVNWSEGGMAEGFEFYDAPDGETIDQPEWITIVEQTGEYEDYHFTVLANEGEARSAYFKAYTSDENTLVYSNLVTVTQEAYEVPGDEQQFALFGGDLVEGDYIIYYNGKAMNNVVSSGRLQYAEIEPEDNVITTDNPAIVWHIAQNTEGYWTIYSADANAYAASTGVKNKAQMLEDGTDDMAMWTVTEISGTYEFVNKANAAGDVNANLRNNGTYGFACYGATTGGALSLYKYTETVVTYTMEIDGYGTSLGGYYLIASPVLGVTPTIENGFLTDVYDLYYFDQAEPDEWRNYEAKSFNIASGKGYLYASQEGTTLTFSGAPYSGDGTIALAKTEGGDFPGWNLVGNPYGDAASIDRDFYVLQDTDEGSMLIQSSGAIAPMQGVFVVAERDGETLTFNPEVSAETGEKIILTVRNNRANIIDRALVRFGEGRQLPKFMFNPNSTKLYISQNGEDFAVVRSINENSTPVNFHAAVNGNYTLSVNPEDVEMEYLHLIDNMTGTDIDLLATPSYTFEARTTDYASRFNLVYATYDDVNENNTKPFAFFDGSEWVINNLGNATLQVVDVTGRMLSSETINGCANVNVNAAPGVYMLRLINGDNVKVQKVVVR